jgi:hypothetical protein
LEILAGLFVALFLDKLKVLKMSFGKKLTLKKKTAGCNILPFFIRLLYLSKKTREISKK